ncbi:MULTISPECIES: DUF397 domain-containing protein [Streptomyces]|uniref:DUF397 domain-containing protein n=1 Tax=Streptomyces TaxID=1883 RepID=UPI001F35A7B1|nr:DUF397 domain-containing protein [Streptomyces lycii]
MAVRDSERRDIAPLRCTLRAWAAFRQGLVSGPIRAIPSGGTGMVHSAAVLAPSCPMTDPACPSPSTCSASPSSRSARPSSCCRGCCRRSPPTWTYRFRRPGC